MAEKILNTRVLLKIDTLENWNSSTLPLKKGELALATVAASAGTGLTEPVVMIKVGEDGVKTFKDLEWNVYAKASDVLSACKSEAGLTAFIKNVVAASDGDLAALASRVTAVEGLVGEKSVAVQISEAITALNLANTYDAKGAAAAAESAAKTYADGLNTAMNTRVEALEAIDHDHDNKAVLDGITAEKVAAWDAAEQNAKDYADDLDEAMDTRVLALEAKFGDGEGNVEAQIAAAVAAEAELREAADADLLEKIEANDAEILALQGLVGDKKVSEAIAEAVKAEEDRAKGIEGGLETRLAAVEANYATDADVEGLQTQINTIMNNPDAEGAINSINEFTAYVAEHGTIADGMRTDINKNKEDIAAEVTRATGVESGLDTRLQAVEAAVGESGSVAGDIADALAEAKGYTDTEVKELADGAVATNAADISALETKVGDKAVATQIQEAIDALKIGDYAKAADLTAAIARIAQNETDIDALEGRMDTAEGDIDALETEVAKKANDADLAAIAKTGNVNDLVQTTGDVLVFDCGTSAV